MNELSKIIRKLLQLIIDSYGIAVIIMFLFVINPVTHETYREPMSVIWELSIISFTILAVIQLIIWINTRMSLKSNTAPYHEHLLMPDNVRAQIASHEAGHAIMCHALCLPLNEIHISPQHSYTGIEFTCLNADDIRKMILVLYAGAAAEDICHENKSRLPGNNESPASDFKKANDMLKEYIVLTDDTVSKTYIDTELTDHMIFYSKQFYKETTKILFENEHLLHALEHELYTHGMMGRQQIIQFFIDQKGGNTKK